MNIKNTNHKNFGLALLFLGSFAAFSFFPSSSPTIKWAPERIESNIFPGGIRTLDAVLTSTKDIENVEIRVVPALQPFVTVTPNNFDFIGTGESKDIRVIISVPPETPLETFDGVIQVRGREKSNAVEGFIRGIFNKPQKPKVFAKPLPVEFTVVSAEPALTLLEEFLLEEFGTLEPPIEFVSDAIRPIEGTQEIFDAFAVGTEGALVISIGSLRINRSLAVSNVEAEEGLADLLDEVELRGIIVDDLRVASVNHKIYQEGTEEAAGLLIRPFADAVVFLPFAFPIILYDENDNKLPDHVILVDENSHALHKAEDINALVARDFFTGSLLKEAPKTIIHELLHPMVFRTKCFVAPEEEDEKFVSDVERLIATKLSGPEFQFIGTLRNTLREFPEGKNCLDRLGLVLPPVTEPPWPQFQHDARHTGQSPFVGPQTDNIKWSFVSPITPRGGFIQTPVVGPDETVYFGAGTQGTGRLFAVNPDGTLKWQSVLLGAAPTNPAIITDGMVIVVVGTEDFGTDITAFDDNGNTLWTFPVGNRVDFITVASEDLVYFTNESGFLFSVTISETGATQNWQVDLGGIAILRSSPAIGQDGTIYIVDRAGTGLGTTRIFALNPQDGSSLWTRAFSKTQAASSAIILDDGTVVIAADFALRGFNPQNGTDVFRIPYNATGSSVPTILPDGRIAVVTESTNTLHRINPATQTVTSTSILNFTQRPNPIVDSQGTIYLATDRNTIVGLTNNDTILFTRSFVLIPENLALGSNSTLYVPVVDVDGFKMVAIGPSQ